MKVAVTGANGHLGANLCRQLLDQGYKINALIHNEKEALYGLDINLFSGDVTDYATLKEVFRGCEIVFHLAAKISIHSTDKAKIFSVNVKGTENVLKACVQSGIRRMIHLSTIHTYQQKPLDEKLDELSPVIKNSRFIYKIAKAQSEEKLVNDNSDTEVIILNPSSIIGPFDFQPSLMGTLQIKLYSRNLPGLVHGGYNWVDVRDVSSAAISAIDKGVPGEKYILSGKWTSLAEFASIMERESGTSINIRIIPDFIAKLGVPFISMYSKLKNESPLYTFDSLKILKSGNRCIDHSKAKRVLGFNPRPLEETIKDTYLWFKENNYLK